MASRSRSAVGNAYAWPTRRPKRSISRLRIAKAAWSETCCAVIEVTSVSNGSGRERRPEAGELLGQPAQHRVVLRPGVEPLEVERRAEQRERHPPRLAVERLDVRPARRRLDPHFAHADDAVQPAVDPEVREVRPEGAEAFRRELEVERLRETEQAHASARKSVSGSYGTPRRSRNPASDPVA